MSATEWSDVDMAELLPTGTVTLLLADVEGSTQLWDNQPEAMTGAIARMNQAASGLIAEHGGVRPVEQGEGDSFVAAFARAGDAVACALELQRVDWAPIKLRIGVHTGDVQLRDEGNYAGTTINKTARLRDLAHGGQTVMSSITEELVEDRLPDGAWLTDLGRHSLRDLPRPVRVAQLCHADVRNDFLPLRTSTIAAAHHLPTQLTTFVGRHAQMAEVRNVLAGNRLVTLTGAGGAGKTRLAIEVAGELTQRFADGVWYVDLAPITHPGVVPLTVARALGLPDQPGSSITETLLRFIRDRHILLVLDNCEHVLDASAALVNDILGSCTNVTILATSREPLMVGGEVNWQVPSLSLADEAIDLFADRARRARPNFTVDERRRKTVIEICHRLDGMPLAIELAAARVRALTLDEILDSLHDRFRLLTGGARTAVRRQQTLRASVDWSHALLTEPERALLRRLSVFMGGFDLDAAQSVAGTTDVERYQVLDQLSLLVDKSLVIAENAGGRTRYRLLETVRQYALEKLGESGEAADNRGRHRDHYTGMAKRLDAPSSTSKERLVEQAEIEIDNLRAAFVWSRESNDFTGALELASSLQPLWVVRGRVAEGAAWLDSALAGLDGDDLEAALPIYAKALADRVMLGLWAGGVADPVRQAEEAVAIARDVDDPALLSRALTACGCAYSHDYTSARPYFNEATSLARSIGDIWWLCQIFGRQSNGAYASGEFVDAESISREGMELADALGDPFGSNQCRVALVTSYVHRGEMAAAIGTVRDLIERATRANDLMSKIIGLFEMAFVLAFRGDGPAARAAADAAIGASRDCPGFVERSIHMAVATACLADGDLEGARQAALTAERVDVVIAGVDDLHMLWAAQVALACNELDMARRRAEIAISASNGSWLAIALSTRARVCVAQGDNDQAESDGYEALTIANETDAHLSTADTLECLASTASDAESHSEATRLLGAAESARQRLGLVRFKVFDDAQHVLVSALRNVMGDAFDATWAEGAALSIEKAIAYALRGRGERKRPSSGWGSLTPTELDVVRLVAEGIPNKDIAGRLFVSPRTVQSHLRHVYNKLGLTSRVQLAQEAARHGKENAPLG